MMRPIMCVLPEVSAPDRKVNTALAFSVLLSLSSLQYAVTYIYVDSQMYAADV